MSYLNVAEIEFLISTLKLNSELRKGVEKALCRNGFISDDIADELRELCLERLDYAGFDDNYELTEEGQKLESLIDKLFVG